MILQPNDAKTNAPIQLTTGTGATILVDDLRIALVDPSVTVALTEGATVELSETALTVSLADPSLSVTIDTGFSVQLEPDLEVDLG